MVIIYEDEYSESVFWGATTYPANVGDIVVVDGEEWHVKSRVFYPQEDKIVIVVTQRQNRISVAESKDTGRQNQMHNAIIELSKRQDVMEKKNRALGDQLSVVRHSVNNRIKQDKKDKE